MNGLKKKKSRTNYYNSGIEVREEAGGPSDLFHGCETKPLRDGNVSVQRCCDPCDVFVSKLPRMCTSKTSTEACSRASYTNWTAVLSNGGITPSPPNLWDFGCHGVGVTTEGIFDQQLGSCPRDSPPIPTSQAQHRTHLGLPAKKTASVKNM